MRARARQCPRQGHARGRAGVRADAGGGRRLDQLHAELEIYTGLQTGVLDAVNTSSGSFVSYRIYEQVDCLTPPGDVALWFMYEPILMSKASFERLDEAQQKALLDAGQKAEDYFFEAAKGLDVELVEAFEKAGVTVKAMSQDQFDQWLDLARTSSYKVFAEEVPGGDQLIEKALAVE